VVENILEKLKVPKETPRIYVFNKIDKFESTALQSGGPLESLKQTYSDFHPQFISTKSREGLNQLKKTIALYINPNITP